MAKLNNEMIEYIKERAETVSYGTITIELNEGGNFSRILVTEEKRFKKEEEQRPRQIIVSKTFNKG